MPKRRVARHEVTQPADTSYRFIALTQGQNAIVDAADFEWLNQWNWCAVWSKDASTFYVQRRAPSRNRKKGTIIRMHRQILDAPADKEVDHRDGNSLNNRRDNLRACTPTQNRRNGIVRKTNQSRYKGVIFSRQTKKKWRAQILRGELILTGYFDTAEEAARAYDEAAIALHGEFACLNFPHRNR